MSNTSSSPTPRLTSLAHGGGCGCKIAPGVLSELLASMPAMSAYPNLLVGTDTADDAAVYQLNDEQALIATTDFFMPVVDDPYQFGRIAATNALSDVYAMGGTPIMALAIVGMPINTLSKDDIAQILKGGADVCQAAGIPIAGGHTIDSVEPIYGLAAMGLVHPQHVRKNAEARAGDVLILSKGLGVGVMSAAFKKNALPDAAYQAMIQSTTQLNTPGVALGQWVGVHAMTDVTGFGLLGHAWEIARGSALTIELKQDQLPWLPHVQDLAAHGYITGASQRNWDAYGAHIELADTLTDTDRALLTDPQTSGGLLISCAPEQASQVLSYLHSQGFDYATQIGQVVAGPAKVVVK
ncbi:selenide, water dikinase SelD [Paenalcaligenes hominis]|uniref:Selenide, water dikinase n=1 Tax=Paenalcaligenes hominis TaxID=643674 RepID=A0A1U9JXA8_9BURK|nr:selenide, water dikinase SelD [Paenalcaligenes hominis]AQS50430.1 selenide, water dikinase SelD [Paenalcaligenes hominis]